MSEWLVIAHYGDGYDIERNGYAVEVALSDREAVVDILESHGVSRFEFEDPDGVRSETTTSDFLFFAEG